MAGQLKLRRGTTSQLANFIGSEGELTYDTTLKSLVLHDGVTLGGVKIPYLSNDLVPSTMLPTATEAVAGKAKIATTAIAQGGTNDTDIITPLKLANTVFGINQTTKVGSYIAGTTYTNTTPKLIFVSVRGTPNQQNTTTSIRIMVGGVLFSAGGGYGADGNSPFGCIAPVPRGSTWSYSVSFASNIVVSELS